MNPDSLLLKLLLFPVSILFGLAVATKNLLYKTGILNGVRFSVPVISIGNLTVGGAGKTPHVEYIIRFLRSYVRIAVMSRGFGRKSTGFLLVRSNHQSPDAGDEPLMFARKYRDIKVAVSESRSLGIPLLLQHHPETQVILLDDAFQHRSVSAHLNILLTEYAFPFYNDWLMPSGTLREWRQGYLRADLIVVTKCPLELSVSDRDLFLRKLRPASHQTVFFSAYRYYTPYSMYTRGLRTALSQEYSVLLVCGIARPDYLIDYVQDLVGHLDVLQFDDHHDYEPADLEVIASRFMHLPGDQKLILTTEKDAMRLEPLGSILMSRALPVFLLPLEVVFLFQIGMTFDDHIRKFLLDFKV